MELKVWVEGIQRIVCGVTEVTTCQDVVYALAHATGKTGRFTLVERWRHNERLLPPHERPLRVLAKWGEYAGDVQLLLRRSPSPPGGSGGGGGGNNTSAVATSPPVANNQPNAKPSRLPQPAMTNNNNATSGDFILDPIVGRLPRPTNPAAPPNGENTVHHGREPLVRKSLTFSGTGGGSGSGNSGGGIAPPTYHDPPPFRDSPNANKRDWSVLPRGVVKGVPQQNYKDSAASPDIVSGGTGGKERCGPDQSGGNAAVANKSGRAGQIGPPQYQPPPTIHRTDAAHNGRVGYLDMSRDGAEIGEIDSQATNRAIPTVAAGSTSRAAQSPASQELPSACAMIDVVSPTHSPSAGHHPSTTAAAARPPSSDTVLVGPPSASFHHQQLQQQHPGSTPFRGPPMPLAANRHSSPSNNLVSVESHHQPSPPPPQQQQQHHQDSYIKHQQQPQAQYQQQQQQPAHRGATSPPAARLPVPIHMGTPKSRRNLLSEFRRHDLEEELREDSFLGRGHQERVVYDARYKDLVRLINLQREKLGRQQADLTQCDAEIMYWEEKQRDHQRQIEIIEREIEKAEYSGRDADEEVVQLNKLHLDDEMGIGRQQEKMLQSELTLLRSKLSNCETELLQCKNKIRLLMEEIIESKRYMSKEEEDRKQRETVILHDIEDLQRDIEQRIKQYDNTVDSVDKLDSDIRQLESAILEKKKQIECLVHEMKEANLASLTFTPSEEIRLLLEGGAHKGPGSSRKIVGSPRQLENAVPTSKNPHGVWV